MNDFTKAFQPEDIEADVASPALEPEPAPTAPGKRVCRIPRVCACGTPIPPDAGMNVKRCPACRLEHKRSTARQWYRTNRAVKRHTNEATTPDGS
jgi:hypothetical protein